MTFARALFKVKLNLFKGLVTHKCQDTPRVHVSEGVAVVHRIGICNNSAFIQGSCAIHLLACCCNFWEGEEGSHASLPRL